MTPDGLATAFVTEADGFLGAELVRVLVARGHEVLGLAASRTSAERVRHAGGAPIIGELLTPGRWQDEAATDWVFHVPPPLFDGSRVTRKRAAAFARARVTMDAHLLDAVAAGMTRRVVYVADASCYGPTGRHPVTEDGPPRPAAAGRCFTPALDRLKGYMAAGLPIVTALPGWVYGAASWFHERVMQPVLSGQPVLQVGKGNAWVSPIHFHDCARALVHLAECGEPEGRYFLVNNDPVQVHDFAKTCARVSARPLKVRRVPSLVARILIGSIGAECLDRDAVFSNIRLRGTGFQFRYHTLEQGIRHLLRTVHE